MKRLKQRHIIHMHEILIEEYGGLSGVRDEHLLDSALNAPFQTFDGNELYPGLIPKAACLSYGLINDHAFHDGNKRVGILALVNFLDINGVEIEATNNELIELGLKIAAGSMPLSEVMEWLYKHIP